MPKITITADLRARLAAYLPVVEHFVGEKMALDEAAETLIRVGIDETLRKLWGPGEDDVRLRDLMELAQRHPAAVYSLVAERLAAGEQAQQAELAEVRQQLRRRPGFLTEEPVPEP